MVGFILLIPDPLNIFQRQPAHVAPGGESAGRVEIRLTGIVVADRHGKELEETYGGLRSGLGDQAWDGDLSGGRGLGQSGAGGAAEAAGRGIQWGGNRRGYPSSSSSARS